MQARPAPAEASSVTGSRGGLDISDQVAQRTAPRTLFPTKSLPAQSSLLGS
jgi:hypothetical protein